MKPIGNLVHSTGCNNPYLKRYVDCPDKVGVNQYGNHWNQYLPGEDGKKPLCVHAFVGYDINKIIKVANILPYNFASYGCSKGINGSYNYDPHGHIQFEICEDGLTDKVYFDNVFKVAAEYSAFLCKQFHFPVDMVISHAEAHARGYASNHGDPDSWLKKFGKNMDDYRNEVSIFLSGKKLPSAADKLKADISGKIENAKIKIPNPPLADDEDLEVGDNVNINGIVYLDSYAQMPKDTVNGKGKITRIVTGKNQIAPYLVSGTRSGWYKRASLIKM
jgi:N-acetylmuramoyl-L-alanine amidase